MDGVFWRAMHQSFPFGASNGNDDSLHTPASTHAYLQGAQKWGLCILLFPATTLNYLDRQTLSILAPTIQRDMGFDNETSGWLFSIFYYTYTVSQFAVGLLLDLSNLRCAYGLAVLAWSVVAGLTGLAIGVLMLAVLRGLLGVTESANWLAAMRTVARSLPAKDRPLGNDVFTSGSSVGALIALTIRNTHTRSPARRSLWCRT